MIATRDIDDIIGAEAVGPDDDRIGKVGQIYIDQDDEQPVWVSVRSGLFGHSESLVPLQGAEWDRSALHLAFTKDRVRDAPRVEPDAELAPEEQERLYEYYGLTSTGAPRNEPVEGGRSGAPVVDDPIRSDRDRYTAAGGGEGPIGGARNESEYAAERGRDPEGSVGNRRDLGAGEAPGRSDEDVDVPDRRADDAMTRSEERLNVRTERVQAGRARLRKYVVTEQQTITVPVTREEVRIKREPIAGEGRGERLSGERLSGGDRSGGGSAGDDAAGGSDLSDDDQVIVLHEERPVVLKETVPVERVRLGKESVTEQQQVTEDVRREEIETEDPRAARADER